MSFLDLIYAYEQWREGVLWSRDVVDQIQKFSSHQIYVQRVLAVLASTTSIVFCLAALYMYFAMDPRRIVFRHHLILYLLCYDLLKAIILLLYPLLVLTNTISYYNERFCHSVGFFTATAVEGADFAIFSFALHTSLLIFKTNLSVRLPNGRTEGGLYQYRYYVYILSILIPLVMASLAFIGEGYNPYVCWCYLPQHPVWYRLVLSWVPRFVIIVLIFTFYIMIYVHVIQEFKALGGLFTKMNLRRTKASDEKPTFFLALKYAYHLFLDTLFPHYDIPSTMNSENTENERKLSGIHGTLSPKSNRTVGPDEDDDFSVMNPNLYGENLENFRKRQKIILKQMKLIFVYPVAYIFIWLFPFILFCTQVNYEEKHGPVYWLNCMGAFMQPLNGFVDLLVFFYREIPWECTVMSIFAKENAERYVAMVITGQDLESIATSARQAKHLISASMAHDINHYLYWRQILHHLKLPFYRLPTQENVTKVLEKMEQEYQNNANSNGNILIGMGSGAPGMNHDFLNILSGDLLEKEFRVMELFSLGQRSHLVISGNSKRASMLNRLWKSRLQSLVDPILEGRISNAFSDTTNNINNNINNINNNSNNGSGPGRLAVPNTNNTNNINNTNHSLHENNSLNVPNSNSVSLNSYLIGGRGRSSDVGHNRLSFKKLSGSGLSVLLTMDDNEMDFLEFLRKGPQ